MRILITGGTGFIGSHLSRRLLDAGQMIRILSLVRSPTEERMAERLRRGGAEIIEGSVTDAALREQALDGVDVVHHIAATMTEAAVPDELFWDTNVRATQALVLEAERAGVRRFVYCSTMGVTRGARGRLTDETEPYAPGNIYERTKAAAEAWILAEYAHNGRGDSGGLELVAVRPADVYGPGDERFLKLARLIKRGRFMYLGNGAGRRHMIHIDDLVDGLIAAQAHPAAPGEVFLLAGPAPIRLRDLVNLVADELEAARPRLRLPFRPAYALAKLCEGVCGPFGIQPPIHPRRVQFFDHDYEFDTSKARRVLQFAPRIPTRDGIRSTMEAYRAEGLLA